MKKSFLAVCIATAFAFLAAFTFCVSALNSPVPTFAADDSLVIVLDAGHGGIDGGVSGRTTGVKESDLNLAITLCLKDLLTDCGFSVTLTRKTEDGLYGTTAKGFKRRDMEKRKEIVEKADPAFVVSIHQNFYPSQSTRGAQVFYLKSSEEGRAFAEHIQNSLNVTYQTVGVKARKETAANYYMLERTENPSVIVECGFLSNAEDEKLLQTTSWQKKISEAILSGVLSYLDSLQVSA